MSFRQTEIPVSSTRMTQNRSPFSRGIKGVLDRKFCSNFTKPFASALTVILLFQLIIPTNLIPQTQALTTNFDLTNADDYTLEDNTKIEIADGNVQLVGSEETVEDVFSTYLYTGNGSTQSIENGIDLENNGGLVWKKARSGTYGTSYHHLVDTERGTDKTLSTNVTELENPSSQTITRFNQN